MDKTCSEPGHLNKLSDFYVFRLNICINLLLSLNVKLNPLEKLQSGLTFVKQDMRLLVCIFSDKELGNPRFGEEFVLMKNTRNDFKNAMELYRAHELEIRKASLIEAIR